MDKFFVSFAVIFTIFFVQSSHCDFVIDNFQKELEVSQWVEHSDTVRPEGKSKSSFVIHESGNFRRAVLFTMIDPQSCGAAFTGIKKNVTLDITGYKSLVLRIRGKGDYKGYELVLRDRENVSHNYPNYVNYFEAPFEFDEVKLEIKDFGPYYEGKRIEDARLLNMRHITSIAILAYGGSNLPVKQRGVASLEIDWIKFV